ncbi:MAG TPA: hypothetical protein VFL57_03960, partial [Bryobacteraceae bacterium]|nr:hypothetical protein [Bryobacteraceae bacterium]
DTLGNIVGTLVLFAGTDTPGKTVQFSPGNSNWGFFFATGAGSYYTERLLGSDATMQHFAIFRDAADVSTGLNFTKLWIGAEESPGAAGFPDYNDMIFTLTCNECGSTTGGELGYVPEPDTWITFGSGVVLVSAAMVLGRVRASRLQSATLRRGSDARNRPQECSSGCLCSDGGSSARLAAGIVQTSASVSDSVRQ